MKFEEAYSTYDHRLHSVDEIYQLTKSEPQRFVLDYQKSFVCPECNEAKLSYNNAVTPYFKTYPMAIHNDDCTLRQNEMSSNDAQRFAESPENVQLIQQQMTSILNLLFKATLRTAAPATTHKAINFPSVGTSPLKSFSVKRLGRKRIDLPMRAEDYKCFKYFYGHTSLKWEKDTDKWKILLFHRKKSIMLCKISVSENVYRYLPDEYKTPSEFTCSIAFMAEAHKVGGKQYFRTYLQSSNNLLIRRTSVNAQLMLF